MSATAAEVWINVAYTYTYILVSCMSYEISSRLHAVSLYIYVIATSAYTHALRVSTVSGVLVLMSLLFLSYFC